MAASIVLPNLSEDDLARLAQDLAFTLAPGDALALSGDLGAGKTTFARAFIRAATGDLTLDVPSPTFTLVQSYETPRFQIAHFDLYRLDRPDDLDELGFEAALGGVALIEWPERAGAQLPDALWSLRLEDGDDDQSRNANLSAAPALRARLARHRDIRAFLDRCGWGGAGVRLSYLQGDASPRRYARIQTVDGRRAILMDSPTASDGPLIRDGKPYSRIAHLAEDVRAFVAIDLTLRERGFSAPEIFAHELDTGLLLIEDFGDAVFGAEVDRGLDQGELWRRGVDTLAALAAKPPADSMSLPDGGAYSLPRLDAGVLEIETALLLDWYWPALRGASAPSGVRAAYEEAWSDVFKAVLAEPFGWMLRDFHSPNLIALDDRTGPSDVGIIDFQDALQGPLAFDLVSLLQDARLDVAADLEAALLARYIENSPRPFDEERFRFCYAALGAQRNTKILGIFARLAMRDGKRQYLAHLPRIWGYLERNLTHPGLAGVRAWYDAHIPAGARRRALAI